MNFEIEFNHPGIQAPLAARFDGFFDDVVPHEISRARTFGFMRD